MEPDIQQIQQITMQHIIQVLRTVKKNDKLFKPLKKLKSALQKFDIKYISTAPTSTILLFHFGLGSQIDKQLLQYTHPQITNASDSIIPGKAYCFLQFGNIKKVNTYVANFQKIMNYGFYYDFGNQEKFQKGGSRIFIALFWKGQVEDTKIDNQNLKNCQRKYQEGYLPGLILQQNFLNEQQQQEILKEIEAKPWQRLNNRRVQHYGFEFKYGANNINKQQKAKYELPQWTKIILKKFQQNYPQIVKINDGYFDQLTINDYFAGDGIPAHFDTHSPFDMLSGTVMEFRKYDGQEKNIYFPSRCLVIFSGQARFAWTHAISCRKVDKIDEKLIHRQRRISLTFRKIRFQPCCCPYYFYCDSQGYDQKKMKKNNPLLKKYLHETKNQQIIEKLPPQQLEHKYVTNAYNGFGHNFDNEIIPDIRKFLQNDIQLGDFVLDVGCGNGIYQNAIKNVCYYVGVEACKLMSGSENQERIYMDGKKLFFKQNSFDVVLLIAVLHHFTTQQGRLICLHQIYRVLGKGGCLYLTVFDYESKKHIYRSQDTLWQYCLPTHKIMQQNQENKQQPYQSSRGDVYERYYHLFEKQELIKLVEKAKFEILSISRDTDNIIMKVRKN